MGTHQINCTDNMEPLLKASIRLVNERKGIVVQPGTLIGLTGFKRVGKDTIANILVEDYGFVKTGFATPIREYVAQLFGWTLEELEQNKETPLPDLGGITARYAMQTLGTEWGRTHLATDFWVRSWERRHRAQLQKSPVVITDIRFPNEAEMVIRLGGYVVRVERDVEANDTHVSERPIPAQYIYVSVQNDDWNALTGKVERLLRGLKRGAVAYFNHDEVQAAVTGEW